MSLKHAADERSAEQDREMIPPTDDGPRGYGSSGAVFMNLPFRDKMAMLVLFLVIGLTISGFRALYGAWRTPPKPAKDASAQLSRLDDAQKALNSLSSFVEDQKTRIHDTEAALSKLSEEKAKLTPVVEADRKTVDAVLAVYEERNRASVWWDRAFGLFTGMLGSLGAPWIVFLVQKRKRGVRVPAKG